MILEDSAARARALAVDQSFLVSAPAGSGKTTLLIQRITALRAQGRRIVALTFTRKAAEEIRSRARVAAPVPDTGSTVIIQTIDAWIWNMLQQLAPDQPVLEITADPEPLYTQAARIVCEEALWAQPMRQLLQTSPLRLSRWVSVFADCLACRDQWVPYLARPYQDPQCQQTFYGMAQIWITDALHAAAQALAPFAEECGAILLYAGFSRIHGTTVADLPAWQQMARLWRTQAGGWRTTVDARQGFPAPSAGDSQTRAARKAWKLRHAALAEAFSRIPGFAEALDRLLCIPTDPSLADAWIQLTQIAPVLRGLLAALQVVFDTERCVDHTELLLRLQAGLETPAGWAVLESYFGQISDLLIDEFQDVSAAQYRLFVRLVEEWQGLAKTVFLVGDPMQSIYGFRGAAPDLFARLWETRQFGPVPLETLTVSTNFRSTRALQRFVRAVFHAESAGDTQGAVVRVAHAALQETVLAHARHAPHHRIGVLSRTRKALLTLASAWAESGVSCYVPEGIPVIRYAWVQDLLTVLRILYGSTDRTVWAAFLRGPLIQLPLCDLTQVLQADPGPWDLGVFVHVWQSGACRHARSLTVEPGAVLAYWQAALAEHAPEYVLFRAWLELGGTDWRGDPTRHAVADLVRAQLAFYGDRWESGMIQALETRGVPVGDPDAPIQCMTIHQSKGLEFDAVFVLALGDRVRGSAPCWFYTLPPMLLPNNRFLRSDPPEGWGAYWEAVQRGLREQEAERLLYVALTRAKSHWYGVVDGVPRAGSFARRLEGYLP